MLRQALPGRGGRVPAGPGQPGPGGLGQARAWPWPCLGFVGAAEDAGDSLSPAAFCAHVGREEDKAPLQKAPGESQR